MQIDRWLIFIIIVLTNFALFYLKYEQLNFKVLN